VTEHGGGTVYLWPLGMQPLIELACRTVGHNMALTEWQLTFPEQPYEPTCPTFPPHYTVESP
jgi:hypothetical protein